jgi:bla regulator protein blaR1
MACKPKSRSARWVAAVILLAAGVSAQSLHTRDATPSFDVQTIKPGADAGSSTLGMRAGELIVKNFTLGGLIQVAYHLHDFQISGGPDWMNSERFDIDAKPMGNMKPDQSQKTVFPNLGKLQALLQERFKLKMHRETRQLPVYSLKLGKRGPGLRRSEQKNCATFDWILYPPSREPWIPSPCSAIYAGPNVRLNRVLNAEGMRIAGAPGESDALTTVLSSYLDRVVIDKTGLRGRFDIFLEWSHPATLTELARDDGAPAASQEDDTNQSLFAAMEQRLGLKLERDTGPVEVLVIDHAEKPSQTGSGAQ